MSLLGRSEKSFSVIFEYNFSAASERRFSPRDNVIIRLCAMECNYAAPLSDDSNKEFQFDIVNWSKVSQRIFIWDYITSFANYIIPFPNWFVLGPNVRVHPIATLCALSRVR